MDTNWSYKLDKSGLTESRFPNTFNNEKGKFKRCKQVLRERKSFLFFFFQLIEGMRDFVRNNKKIYQKVLLYEVCISVWSNAPPPLWWKKLCCELVDDQRSFVRDIRTLPWHDNRMPQPLPWRFPYMGGTRWLPVTCWLGDSQMPQLLPWQLFSERLWQTTRQALRVQFLIEPDEGVWHPGVT